MGKVATMADVLQTNEEAFFFLISCRPDDRFRHEMRHQRALIMKCFHKEMGARPISRSTKLPPATSQMYLRYCLWLYRYQLGRKRQSRKLTLKSVLQSLLASPRIRRERPRYWFLFN